MSPLLTLILALLITIAIEVPLGALILKRKDSIIPLILINILTNPALNVTLMLIFSLTHSLALYWIALAVGEIVVFVGEGLLINTLCDLAPGRSLSVSTVLNAVSLILGSAILTLL